MKIYNTAHLLLLALILLCTSCLDDDSTAGDRPVNDIAISGLEESYTAIAYAGRHLKISPVVNTGYAADDMAYTWTLIDDKTGDITSDGDTIQPRVIGHAKDLDYDVEVMPGNYKLRFEARAKDNGYTVYASMKLTVESNFSKGFYVVKETADGNTDLDLLAADGTFTDNLLTRVDGAALKGKPLSFAVNYKMWYINPDNDQMESTNAVTLVTEDNRIEVRRLTDLKTVFDRSNLLFDPMPDDEKPYTIVNTADGDLCYYSSKGIRVNNMSDFSSAGSGRYGVPEVVCGGSRFITQDLPSFGGTVFWDETAHTLMVTDYNTNATPMVYENHTGGDLTTGLASFDCLHIGYNIMNGVGTATVILADKATGKRYLYLTKSDFNGIYLLRRVAVDEGLHMAKATSFSTNGWSAKYIYCVDNGAVYACLWDNDKLTEVPISVQGIGTGEQIVYVGNQFWQGNKSAGDPFNYLVVGTQKGNDYAVYMYPLVGGAPQGQPVHTIRGTGRLYTVRYVSSGFDSLDWSIFQINVFNMNN